MPQHRDVVVVGASAGGVEALRELLSALPADLPAAVLVVLHMPTGGTSALPAILRRAGRLHVQPAANGASLRHGHVYTAVPDHHLLVVGDVMALSRGLTENGHRPAVDVLFRSAAHTVGPRAIGVVLSGSLDDGAAGLMSIAAHGGAAVVQEPVDAICAGMPANALREVPTARVAPIAQLADVITELTAERVGGQPVGHDWTEEALAVRKDDALERALWTALRTLDEKISLGHRMEQTAMQRGNGYGARWYAASVAEATQAADVLRHFIRDDVLAQEGTAR
ncbi:chemotaxis protein CheB [Kutzneria buriramensis]|uniref:protein-glutamate methylesterase n=1 Tax=Kutzneria buriramensis TaxID=1045776 RepID=A0A3E0H7N3_9PSEU|nr:chemotaxis protein CheB [Kutzneria buriramensis]REH39328.1 two-component system chemotaxis response regulator CheB [Kutzneria buriramensis]